MIRAQKIVLFISCLIAITILFSCSNNEIITYYDANWNETTKENASFYRSLQKNKNGNWDLRDFYISGEKQFVGQVKDSLATILEGDVIWYFKTGKVQERLRYENGKVIEKFTVVEGAKGSVEEGWDEKDTYYYDQLKVANAQVNSASAQSISTSAPRQRTDVYEYYYAKTSTVAGQHTDIEGYDDKFSFTLFFDTKGDTIGRLDYNKTSDKWQGKEIVFYQTEKKNKNEVSTIKEINTYKKGLIERTQYFNENEEQIADGSFKNKKPYTGTFFKEACWFSKIQHFKKGNLQKEITFINNDEKIGEISFKNKEPYTGVFCNCPTLKNYKNGKLDGQSIKYLYGGIGEDLEEEYNFNYKNGLKHGDYTIYNDEGFLLEKGTYKNDVQVGEVWYYHNEEAIEEGDAENFYYLKTNVQSVKGKPFISGISQFNLENELLNTFEFEPNTTDEFSYIHNGYHYVHLEDLNADGFDDLQIMYQHKEGGFTLSTYYLFNSEINKYQHIDELDDVTDLEVNVSDKTITTTTNRNIIDDHKSYVTYEFLNDKLIRKLEIEEVYHQGRDTTFRTQIFPVPVDDFPLLDENLPPITFVQKSKQEQITNTHQTVVLQKEPFSIVFPGLINSTFPKDFNVKITASYDKNVFKKARVNHKEEDTSIFEEGTTFARAPNELIVYDEGHNLFYYDKTQDANLDYLKNISENVLLLQLEINKMHDGDEEQNMSEINKPIYMVIYMDKNENKKIDDDEIFYVTVNS